MRYQLPNGKSIDMTLDEYLNLTDDEIQFLVAHNYGDEPKNNPWGGSALNRNAKERITKKDKKVKIEDNEFTDEDESAGITDLDLASDIDKIEDLDMPPEEY